MITFKPTFKTLTTAVCASLILAGAVVVAVQADEESKQHISIGTGGITGVYYTVGGAICRLVKRIKTDVNIDCRAESTAGSIYNLNSLLNGELDFAIVQADWHYQYAKDPEKGANLRSVLSLHTETFTVFAHPDSEIETFDDLKGKRVNIGNPGSGQRGTMEQLMAMMQWTEDDFILSTELKAAEQSSALCDHNIDAAVYMVGHPAAAIQEAITLCDAKIIGVDPKIVAKLMGQYPYYRTATIAANTYSGQDADVSTFGLSATLVTRADVDASIVKAVTTAIFQGLGALRRAHPALARLQQAEMAQVSNFALPHPGALEVMDKRKLVH
ncbi:MAG: TAXI family TRAP transporter solute-binding subunit [Gammaproteobacteria bacterium]|nr:TAXI family TRAP transporter solute-binding subunit [Pseudomonadota bacterium]MCH9662373.1 TAXI family TRAP transporter solute-binding subunit [Gammaproteobacteria bacterium]